MIIRLMPSVTLTDEDLKYGCLDNFTAWVDPRVSVRGVKSLGGHFSCLGQGFEFYEVKKINLLLFFKKKMEILLHF